MMKTLQDDVVYQREISDIAKKLVEQANEWFVEKVFEHEQCKDIVIDLLKSWGWNYKEHNARYLTIWYGDDAQNCPLVLESVDNWGYRFALEHAIKHERLAKANDDVNKLFEAGKVARNAKS